MSADQALDFVRQRRIFVQELLGVLAPLPKAVLTQVEPSAALADNVEFHTDIEDVAGAGDAFVVHDIELSLAEGRRNLVFHHLDPGAAADRLLAVLERLDTADIHPHRGVELQRLPAGRRFRRAEHHADLQTQLIEEDDDDARFADGAGEFAQRLAHQARLQAGQRIAHVAFDLGARHECGDRVDHHDIHGVRAHQRLTDFERLLAVVRLGDEQIIDIDAAARCVHRIERMLGVDERSDAAHLLRFGDDVLRQRRFPAGLGPVDFNNATARHAADAKRNVERNRSGGNDFDRQLGTGFAHPHDRTLAVLAVDLAHSRCQSLFFLRRESHDLRSSI